MVQLVLVDDFKPQVLPWYGDTVPMKEPSGFLGKSNLSKHEMHEVEIQTAEPDSTREATKIW